MYISTLLTLSSLTALNLAQTTFSVQPSTSSTCAAQPVLDQCFASTTAIIQTCALTDYGCLCQKYGDLVTCFNVCPNDPRLAAAQSSRSTYCSDASLYSSSTSSAISGSVSGGATTTSAGAATGTGTGTMNTGGAVRASGTGSATSSSASASQSAKSGAEGRGVGAGSIVLGLAGLIGAFL